ncbi:MAG: class I SAM-dependent methyltransferase [Planctomycetota bacterium]|jgi:SAM-dependent methyltransferase
MVACAGCAKLIDGACSAHAELSRTLGRALPPPPLGGCVLPIVEQYAALVQPGWQVLEIGCGSWPLLRDHCASVGAHWEGIDPAAEYFGAPVIATRIENLAALSFADDRFDLVVASQSMEHWAEHGCDPDFGLWQCFRVCKPGGQVRLNVPLHFHGTRDFVYGDVARLRGRFAPFTTQLQIETWGHPSDPLPRQELHTSHPGMTGRAAHIIDLHAVKDRPLPRMPDNLGLTGNRARLVYWPFRFLVRRWLAARRGA